MSEANKSLVRRLIEEAINKGNFKVVDEILSTDYVYGSLRREKSGADQATKR